MTTKVILHDTSTITVNAIRDFHKKAMHVLYYTGKCEVLFHKKTPFHSLSSVNGTSALSSE